MSMDDLSRHRAQGSCLQLWMTTVGGTQLTNMRAPRRPIKNNDGNDYPGDVRCEISVL